MENIEIDGLTFRVEIIPDADAGPPWDNSDGHGPVRQEGNFRRKNSGERVLDYGPGYLYDFNEAVKIAERDAWGVAIESGDTLRMVAIKAAEADYDYLRGFCTGEWEYVGVEVTLLDLEGNATKYRESLWGIDSPSVDYQAEIAREFAQGIAAQLDDATDICTPIRKTAVPS